MNKLFLLTVALLFTGTLSANLVVEVDSIENKENQGTISFTIENTGDAGITAARAWIFLFDEEGKVVGNHAQWMISGKKKEEALGAEEKRSFTTQVKAKRPIATAQVTFSRIVLEDGTMPNPQKFVKPAKTKDK